jgi:hypothetical protein
MLSLFTDIAYPQPPQNNDANEDTIVDEENVAQLQVEHVVLENPLEQQRQDDPAGAPVASSDDNATIEKLTRELNDARAALSRLTQSRLELAQVLNSEWATAIITLSGDPDEGDHGYVRFLRTDLMPPGDVSIVRLHPRSLQDLNLTSRWFDKINLTHIDEVQRALRIVLPPFNESLAILKPGMAIRIFKRDVADPIYGYLEGLDPSTTAPTALFLKPIPGQPTEPRVEVSKISRIHILPDDDPFGELVDIASSFRQPDNRSIRIDWTKPASRSEDPKDKFEVTYQSKAQPWSIQYQVDIQSSQSAANTRVVPRAFIYNRTAYDWSDTHVRLRERGIDRVDYALQDVNLRSQQAGLFPVSNSWTGHAERLLEFSAGQPSGTRPRFIWRIKSFSGDYLKRGTASVFVDEHFFSTGDGVASGATFFGHENPAVTVGYAAVKDVDRLPYEIVSIEQEKLKYIPSVTQTFAVSNTGTSEVDVTVRFPSPPGGWKLEQEARTIKVPAAAADGRPGQASAVARQLRIRPVDETLNLRLASLQQLAAISVGSDADLEKINAIRVFKAQIEKAAAEATALDTRRIELEREYIKYPVISASAQNRLARRDLQQTIDSMARRIAELNDRRAVFEALLDSTLFGPTTESGLRLQQNSDCLARLGIPPDDRFYQGVFAAVPGDEKEVQVSEGELQAFEQAVDKKVALVLMPWDLRTDPQPAYETMCWIAAAGKIPLIRLRLHAKKWKETGANTLQEIIDGRFDEQLLNWGEAVRDFGEPVLVAFGGECNGHWNSWSGARNGGGIKDGFGNPQLADGPERFVAAYRRIVLLVRDGAGAKNITWLFHVNQNDNSTESTSNEEWNKFEAYYPGHKYIDWLGVSIYGAITPDQKEQDIADFKPQLDAVYPRFLKLAADKPLIVAEMGSTTGDPNASASPGVSPEVWTEDALASIFAANNWKNLIGFVWWNERWQNYDESTNPATKTNITNMRVQDIPALQQVFRTQLNLNAARLQQSPVVQVTDFPSSNTEPIYGAEDEEKLPLPAQ